MSRYTKSIFKKSRRLKFSILENNKEFSKGKKRTTTPGQHGKSFQKLTVYGTQLQEKQKLQYMYGLTEKQLRLFFSRAKKNREGTTGDNLLNLLESRLDNLVYRASFAPTRQAARQLVTHGHILINGKKADIASEIVQIGSEIELKEKSLTIPVVKEAMSKNLMAPFMALKETGKVIYNRSPDRKEINTDIKESLIVQWYNRLVK